MSGKDEPIKTRGSRPLDLTPAESADFYIQKLVERRTEEGYAGKLAWWKTQYIHDRVRPEDHLRYVEYYLAAIFAHVQGTRELPGTLVSEPLPDPDALACAISEQADKENRGEAYREQVVASSWNASPACASGSRTRCSWN